MVAILDSLAMMALRGFCLFGIIAGLCAGGLCLIPSDDDREHMPCDSKTILSIACGILGLLIVLTGSVF